MAVNHAVSFESRSEEDIVLLAQDGDKQALEYIIIRYKNFVRSRARRYFLVGADREDMIQEGMIGLFKAIRDYRQERQASFYSFVDMCVRRQMISAVKSATRQKHIPLNSYVSLNKPVFDDNDRTLADLMFHQNACDPEEMMIHREQYHNIGAKVSKILSNFELLVLFRYLDGKSYQEIANELGKHVKAVDNALQRVKRKVEKSMQEPEDKPQAK